MSVSRIVAVCCHPAAGICSQLCLKIGKLDYIIACVVKGMNGWAFAVNTGLAASFGVISRRAGEHVIRRYALVQGCLIGRRRAF